jgi:hypothetical protein
MNTISLVKMVGTKVCRLCTAKRMIIGKNFTNVNRRRKILNLKSELCGVYSCKTRFLRLKARENNRSIMISHIEYPVSTSALVF